MFLLVLAVMLTVAMIAWSRVYADRRAPISIAEWLAGCEIGLLLVTIALSNVVEAFGFACLLMAVVGSVLMFIVSLAELFRIAWRRLTNTRRGQIDSLLCMLTMGIATLEILEVVSEPLWV